MKETIRILNPKQINVFLENKCVPVHFGIGHKKKAYIDFLLDENCKNILQQWREHKFEK